jgi:hypothetical protein
MLITEFSMNLFRWILLGLQKRYLADVEMKQKITLLLLLPTQAMALPIVTQYATSLHPFE